MLGLYYKLLCKLGRHSPEILFRIPYMVSYDVYGKCKGCKEIFVWKHWDTFRTFLGKPSIGRMKADLGKLNEHIKDLEHTLKGPIFHAERVYILRELEEARRAKKRLILMLHGDLKYPNYIGGEYL